MFKKLIAEAGVPVFGENNFILKHNIMHIRGTAAWLWTDYDLDSERAELLLPVFSRQAEHSLTGYVQNRKTQAPKGKLYAGHIKIAGQGKGQPLLIELTGQPEFYRMNSRKVAQVIEQAMSELNISPEGYDIQIQTRHEQWKYFWGAFRRLFPF